MRPSKKEAEGNDVRDKLRPVYCPKCGWKLLDAVKGTKTQTKIPHKGRYEDVLTVLTDCSKLDAEIAQLEDESNIVVELINKCVAENARKAMDQEEYQRQYSSYNARYEGIRKKLDKLKNKRLERLAKKTSIRCFMDNLSQQEDIITTFDEELWYTTVDVVKVSLDGKMTFVFRDGSTVEVPME